MNPLVLLFKIFMHWQMLAVSAALLILIPLVSAIGRISPKSRKISLGSSTRTETGESPAETLRELRK